MEFVPTLSGPRGRYQDSSWYMQLRGRLPRISIGLEVHMFNLQSVERRTQPIRPDPFPRAHRHLLDTRKVES